MSLTDQLPKKVVDNMMARDAYSQWLGIEVLSVAAGHVKLQMTVRKEMLNGFGVCHGGVTFALADSALAFACNSHGRLSVLLNASMAYPAAVNEGDVLLAEAREESLSNKVGIYSVTVKKAADETKVGVFSATVYRTGKNFLDTIESEEK